MAWSAAHPPAAHPALCPWPGPPGVVSLCSWGGFRGPMWPQRPPAHSEVFCCLRTGGFLCHLIFTCWNENLSSRPITQLLLPGILLLPARVCPYREPRPDQTQQFGASLQTADLGGGSLPLVALRLVKSHTGSGDTFRTSRTVEKRRVPVSWAVLERDCMSGSLWPHSLGSFS